jgi:peptide/nickel transport system substrate-binding protein
MYNFDLKTNAVWHDGTPVTSEDVVFTVDLMRDPDSVLPEDLKEFWKSVEVIALSEKSLQFRLSEPFSPFMDYLTFGVVPKHILSGLQYAEMVNSSFNLKPVGSGPYRFDQLIVEKGEIKGVILAANSNYYQKVPYIDQIAFRYFPTIQDAYLAYQEGNVQGLQEVSLEVLASILPDPNLSVYSGRKPEIAMLILNLNNSQVKFFQEKNVRQALLAGINRTRIVDQIFSGQALIANVPILPGTWAYYDGLTMVEYDQQKAIQMLKEAGYVLTEEAGSIREKNGLALTFELLYPNDPYHQAVAEFITADLAKIGVEVTLKAVEYDLLVLDHLQPLNYQAALVDLNFKRSPDPDPYPFWDMSQQTGGQNYSQWENRIVSEYLEQARVSIDLGEREKLYRNFQVIFSDELPALPLYYPIYNYAIDSDFQGIRMGPLFDASDRFFNITNWYLIAQAGQPAEGE